ncbi:hypothetical protein P152DRAFT_314722 [Eremomyces bilateralis CBS 781.70]|uniref:Uncharacterized protein n=1 Tax=Eremomyces bilateralis CBS 781.70 TaxID=1392243 RepID=A0A6G1G5I7_9PEZI|nr:uncharacterized protein P152DRAFT_314722 [Eremomyces bilateralis CBS 781.70]KAF1813323.1 hypothetical protein P152DRAFT_314722 [Eremomyces bilateralis CBS 781.70]
MDGSAIRRAGSRSPYVAHDGLVSTTYRRTGWLGQLGEGAAGSKQRGGHAGNGRRKRFSDFSWLPTSTLGWGRAISPVPIRIDDNSIFLGDLRCGIFEELLGLETDGPWWGGFPSSVDIWIRVDVECLQSVSHYYLSISINASFGFWSPFSALDLAASSGCLR